MTDSDRPTSSAIPDDLSQRAHRLIIGALGLFLPVLVYVFAGIRPTANLRHWDFLDSVSAYYYTGAVGVFVGVLFALSLFLFTYRGYKGATADRLVGTLGGMAALLVALFPTEAPCGVTAPGWWRPTTGVIHYVAAIALFTAFILFSMWLFRKSNIPNRRDRPRDKRYRDDACLVCGIIMIVCVLWSAVASFMNAPIFVPEAIAIGAFATSWLIKGEAHQIVVDGARRVMRRRSNTQRTDPSRL